MVALALLFVIIIGILPIIAWLLKKYFEMYENLYTTKDQRLADFQIDLNLQERLEKKELINKLINERLVDLEKSF